MDKSHKVSGADGRIWSYSCPIFNVKCQTKVTIKCLLKSNNWTLILTPNLVDILNNNKVMKIMYIKLVWSSLLVIFLIAMIWKIYEWQYNQTFIFPIKLSPVFLFQLNLLGIKKHVYIIQLPYHTQEINMQSWRKASLTQYRDVSPI